MNKMFLERQSFLKEFHNKIKKSQLSQTESNLKKDFINCGKCGKEYHIDSLNDNLFVCESCDFHFRINARQRIDITLDQYSFVEFYKNIESVNLLEFPGYDEKLDKYKELTNENGAFICGEGTINGVQISIGVLDSYFMMGSMGSVVGEKVTRLIEHSNDMSLPLIIFSASGGARMQEGIISLMQMAKTSSAIRVYSQNKGLFISVLTNPTTGGVAASFSFLGDYHIAETGALIGFAGQKVIKQTIGQELPDFFQTAEFQLKKGFVDMVVNRNRIKGLIIQILKIHGYKGNCNDVK